MQLQSILFLFAVSSALASPQGKGGNGSAPAKGGGGLMSSIAASFGLDPNADIATNVCKTFVPGHPLGSIISAAFGSPVGTGPDEQCAVDNSGGSGPYNAHYIEVPSLPGHTIYMPKEPPADLKMPVIVWGNGFCMAAGTMFVNFLNEIASHGFFIIANGPATGNQLDGTTTYMDLIKGMDWAEKNPAAKKWNLDLSKLAVAGQSCGGGQAVRQHITTLAVPLIPY
jgi:hypothetical protein